MAVGWTLALTCIIVNTHTSIHPHTHILSRFMDGVTVNDGTILYQHETESLIGQFDLNLITSESDFLCLHHMKALFHHAATSWALPHGTIQNCLLRYRPCREEAWNPACFCECVRACTCLCVCILPWTMNGCIVGLWAIMHAVCVFGGQVHLWRTAWICYHCTPCVFMCEFVTVKSGWSNEILNTGGSLSAT